jgi:hypothetical protein
LWKRYLLVDTDSESAEIDPATVKVEGEHAELAAADIPVEPIETPEEMRDAGPVLRHRFRFGKTNYMELRSHCTSTENPFTDLHY